MIYNKNNLYPIDLKYIGIPIEIPQTNRSNFNRYLLIKILYYIIMLSPIDTRVIKIIEQVNQ